MERKFELPIYNRFRKGEVIVAEVQPILQNTRRWLAIYQPKSPLVRNYTPDHKYSILDFELERSKVDEYFSGEDMLNEKRYYLQTEDDIFLLLDQLGIDPKKFTYPWKCDYPL